MIGNVTVQANSTGPPSLGCHSDSDQFTTPPLRSGRILHRPVRCVMARRIHFLVVIGTVLAGVLIPSRPALAAPDLGSGFAETLVITGFSNPTTMALAPDGRIFVAQ